MHSEPDGQGPFFSHGPKNKESEKSGLLTTTDDLSIENTYILFVDIP